MIGLSIQDALAVLCFFPAVGLYWRAHPDRDVRFYGGLGLALIGAGFQAQSLLTVSWQTDLGSALWISLFASLFLFAVLSVCRSNVWRLGVLLFPYMAVLGVLATVLRGQARPLSGVAPAGWLDVHILVSVLTYAILTLAAMTALAVFLQEQALKRKTPNHLTRQLPSVIDAENLAGALLVAGQGILGAGLLTGMALQYFEAGVFMRWDHKTALSLLAFLMLAALLVGHRVCGVRGRLAARVVLVAYLLLTLAYPGVKFVTQVLRG